MLKWIKKEKGYGYMDNNSTLSAEKMVGQGISPKQKKEAFAAQ